MNQACDRQVRLVLRTGALPGTELTLHSLVGDEGLSRPYYYEVSFALAESSLELGALLGESVEICISVAGIDQRIRGRFSTVRREFAGNESRIAATVVPLLSSLERSGANRIYLDRTVAELTREILNKVAPEGEELDDRCDVRYPRREFTMQYEESDLAFLSRHLEREGIFYFWDHQDKGSRFVLGDGRGAYKTPSLHLSYVPPSGQQAGEWSKDGRLPRTVSSFIVGERKVTSSVLLRDYDNRNPNQRIVSTAPSGGGDPGVAEHYGSNPCDEKDNERLARIRSEQLGWPGNVCSGESDDPRLGPGCVLRLEDHPESACNRDYLIVAVRHEARQGSHVGDVLPPGGYWNQFDAIALDMPFRPERTAAWPRIHGFMHAHVDGTGSGEYAELDEEGRYRVRLPLDSSDGAPGKASHWIRMAQPYAGVGYGFHFPLHKGTEVLLSFLDGDVDRPVIAGAVPNAVTPSPVTSRNASEGQLASAGGNLLLMEDRKNAEHVLISTPHTASFLRLGSEGRDGSGGIHLGSKSNWHTDVGGKRIDSSKGDVWQESEGSHTVQSFGKAAMRAAKGIRFAAGKINVAVERAKREAAHRTALAGGGGSRPHNDTQGGLAWLVDAEQRAELLCDVLEKMAIARLKDWFSVGTFSWKKELASAVRKRVVAPIGLYCDGDLSALSLLGDAKMGTIRGKAALFGGNVGVTARKDIHLAANKGKVEVSSGEAVEVHTPGPAHVEGKTEVLLESGAYSVRVRADKGVEIARAAEKGASEIFFDGDVCRVRLGDEVILTLDRRASAISLETGRGQAVRLGDRSISCSWQGTSLTIDPDGARVLGTKVMVNESLEVRK